MRNLLLFLFLGLCTIQVVPAQASYDGGKDLVVNLPAIDQIRLEALGNQAIALTADTLISLIPPDMARLDQRRILGCENDTFASVIGPDQVLASCWVDTLFITPTVYVENARVEVQYFADGTYEGSSSFGWQALSELGPVSGPIPVASGGAQLFVEQNRATPTPVSSSAVSSGSFDPSTYPQFPFTIGDIDEIRLIKCNTYPATESRLASMDQFLGENVVFCNELSVDPIVPPQKALNRINYPITIRYFEPVHAERATVLAEVIADQLQISNIDVHIEDMLPSYKGVPPKRDYLEIWFK